MYSMLSPFHFEWPTPTHSMTSTTYWTLFTLDKDCVTTWKMSHNVDDLHRLLHACLRNPVGSPLWLLDHVWFPYGQNAIMKAWCVVFMVAVSQTSSWYLRDQQWQQMYGVGHIHTSTSMASHTCMDCFEGLKILLTLPPCASLQW